LMGESRRSSDSKVPAGQNVLFAISTTLQSGNHGPRNVVDISNAGSPLTYHDGIGGREIDQISRRDEVNVVRSVNFARIDDCYRYAIAVLPAKLLCLKLGSRVSVGPPRQRRSAGFGPYYTFATSP